MMKISKYITVSLLLFFLLPAYGQQTTLLKGKVHNWKNEGCLLVIVERNQYDTVRVAHDGTFRYETVITEPVKRGLYLEYLGDDRKVIDCYLLPGETLEINVAAEKSEGRLKSVPSFAGTTRKECEYLYKTSGLWNGFTPEYMGRDGTLVGFKAYRQQVKNYQQQLRSLLQGTRKEFAIEKETEIEALAGQVLFLYAWGAIRNQRDAGNDPDFMAYCDSIDLNDPANIHITEQWIRFYIGQHSQAVPENNTVRFFKVLREKISSEEVRSILADEKIRTYFALGGDEAIAGIFTEYKKTSTNRKTIVDMQSLYDRLSKLSPGVEASDFEMQTVDGKNVRFRDVVGKGKVVYIDFWATWCGPCCMEIPYVEKLVEKYKDNPNIEFLSISLDNDLNKWHKKLESDRPSWAQYVIPENFESAFAKEYNITAIPRFMMFDKEGKIISINAPRPSSDKIDTFLQKYIR